MPVAASILEKNTPKIAASWVANFAWVTLAVNVSVVLWGAFVRASLSGAGCGSHWPLCNGELVMHAPRWHTVVEFTHRASSGVALVMVLALLAATFFSTVAGSLARWSAGLAAFFMFNEALLGALLVLLRKVAMDQSVGRAIYLCAHSANTLLLLGAIALTAYWLTWPEDAARARYSPVSAQHWWPAIVGAMLTLLVATTGAIAALGDTLFPATSLHQAWAQDFAANAHYALRLRGLHPVTATLLLIFVLWLLRKQTLRAELASRLFLRTTLALLLLQYALGLADLLLLAPMWLQIVHLLGADLFWISLTLLLARALPRMRGTHSMAV